MDMDLDVFTAIKEEQPSNEDTSSEENMPVWRSIKTTKRLWDGVRNYPGGRTQFINDRLEEYIESKGEEALELEKEMEKCRATISENSAQLAAFQARYEKLLSPEEENIV